MSMPSVHVRACVHVHPRLCRVHGRVKRKQTGLLLTYSEGLQAKGETISRNKDVTMILVRNVHSCLLY
jgi:hypothetical protein